MIWLEPRWLGLLALVPLIIALHMWRRRRSPRTVSALFLWQRASQASQQQRRVLSWSLLLQVLALCVLSLLLAQPRLLRGGKPRQIVIIDTSASMAAGTRLVDALSIARSLAENSQPILLRAGLHAELVAQDRTSYFAALEQMRAFDARSALAEALDSALALAPDGIIHIISDAAPAELLSNPRVHYHQVGQARDNVGITAFQLTAEGFFSAVYNSAARPRQVRLELWQAQRQLASYTLQLTRQAETSFSASLSSVEGIVELRIIPEDGMPDGLALDNHAFAGFIPPRVVLAPAAPQLERALLAIGGLELQLAPSLSSGLRMPAALYIHSANGSPLDGLEPLPAGRHLIFAAEQVHAQQRLSQVLDWQRHHPLLRFADLSQIRMRLPEPASELVVPPDWQVLAEDSSLRPFILHKVRPEGDISYISLSPTQTNLPAQPAWVILLSNVVGEAATLAHAALGSDLHGTRITEPGAYPSQNGGVPTLVNLFSAEESSLALGNPTSTPGRAKEVATQQTRDPTNLLLAVLLLVLTLEMWLHQRAYAPVSARSSG